jgi:hypothetical protein
LPCGRRSPLTADSGASDKQSLAEEFLDQAIDALRDAGSPETLYPARARTSTNAVLQAADTAQAVARRTKHSRTSMLFSAFAAEAFINQFLYDKLDSSADRQSIDRLPTVEKYVLGTRLATGQEIFDRGAEPIQTIAALFRVRDSLVHSRPTARQDRPSVFDDPPEYGTTNPKEAARAIVAVANAAATLNDYSPVQRVSYRIASVAVGSESYLEFGERIYKNLPRPGDPELPDLAISVLEKLTGKKLRPRLRKQR